MRGVLMLVAISAMVASCAGSQSEVGEKQRIRYEACVEWLITDYFLDPIAAQQKCACIKPIAREVFTPEELVRFERKNAYAGLGLADTRDLTGKIFWWNASVRQTCAITLVNEASLAESMMQQCMKLATMTDNKEAVARCHCADGVFRNELARSQSAILFPKVSDRLSQIEVRSIVSALDELEKRATDICVR